MRVVPSVRVSAVTESAATTVSSALVARLLECVIMRVASQRIGTCSPTRA